VAIVVVVLGLLAAWYFGAVERAFPGLTPKSGFVKRREAAATQASAVESWWGVEKGAGK
jgi:hypothetical protein